LKLRQELAAKVDKDSSKSQRRFLNGWQRAGIVFSVLWAIVAPLLVWQNERVYRDEAAGAYFHCVFAPNSDVDCEAQKEAFDSATNRIVWRKVAWTLLPIPVAWLFVYIMVWLARWIRRGFHPAR
jgi:hypothetical protein